MFASAFHVVGDKHGNLRFHILGRNGHVECTDIAAGEASRHLPFGVCRQLPDLVVAQRLVAALACLNEIADERLCKELDSVSRLAADIDHAHRRAHRHADNRHPACERALGGVVVVFAQGRGDWSGNVDQQAGDGVR